MNGKKLIVLLYCLVTATLLFCSCMTEGMMDVGEGIPLPRTPSIIPLSAESEWLFSHTIHDSATPETADLHCAIDRVYGMVDDTTLVLITQVNLDQKFLLYIYEYEWESFGHGLLVSYRDQNVDTTGIYIHGEYSGEVKTLYPTPILWLKYPAAIGDSWFLDSPDSTDTILPYYEIVDTSAVFSIPAQQKGTLSPLEFVYCYLYRKTISDTISYFYYTPQYGSVGFLEYVSGILNRTYLLKQYSPPF